MVVIGILSRSQFRHSGRLGGPSFRASYSRCTFWLWKDQIELMLSDMSSCPPSLELLVEPRPQPARTLSCERVRSPLIANLASALLVVYSSIHPRTTPRGARRSCLHLVAHRSRVRQEHPLLFVPAWDGKTFLDSCNTAFRSAPLAIYAPPLFLRL